MQLTYYRNKERISLTSKLNTDEEYDLVLLDDMMPKMDGRETLEHIRNDLGKKVPVVALTANAISGMREKYLAMGFDDYLSKPIEKRELYRVLLTYLNKQIKKKNQPNNLFMPKLKEKKPEQKRVLIVDDNKINIKIAEKLLEHFDFLVIDSVLSGKDALERVKVSDYDLIFMDIMMPEMDGIECLHRLREQGYVRPVVTLTADAVERSKEKYLNEGFDDYVAKPVNLKRVEEIVNKFLK